MVFDEEHDGEVVKIIVLLLFEIENMPKYGMAGHAHMRNRKFSQNVIKIFLGYQGVNFWS